MDVLLLNATYEPLRLIDWRKALVLQYLNKVEVLETDPDRTVRSMAGEFAVPSVARLTERVRWRWDTPRFSRENLYRRDKYTCQYCGYHSAKGRNLTFDHVLPRSRGGRTNWRNIVTACAPCNLKKSNKTPGEAEMPLARDPFVPRQLSQLSFKMKEEWRRWMF